LVHLRWFGFLGSAFQHHGTATLPFVWHLRSFGDSWDAGKLG
jgi:hypothetical protein